MNLLRYLSFISLISITSISLILVFVREERSDTGRMKYYTNNDGLVQMRVPLTTKAIPTRFTNSNLWLHNGRIALFGTWNADDVYTLSFLDQHKGTVENVLSFENVPIDIALHTQATPETDDFYLTVGTDSTWLMRGNLSSQSLSIVETETTINKLLYVIDDDSLLVITPQIIPNMRDEATHDIALLTPSTGTLYSLSKISWDQRYPIETFVYDNNLLILVRLQNEAEQVLVQLNPLYFISNHHIDDEIWGAASVESFVYSLGPSGTIYRTDFDGSQPQPIYEVPSTRSFTVLSDIELIVSQTTNTGTELRRVNVEDNTFNTVFTAQGSINIFGTNDDATHIVVSIVYQNGRRTHALIDLASGNIVLEFECAYSLGCSTFFIESQIYMADQQSTYIYDTTTQALIHFPSTGKLVLVSEPVDYSLNIFILIAAAVFLTLVIAQTRFKPHNKIGSGVC